MVARKDKNQKVFCPFCGKAFRGDHNYCPFCGQDIRPYKDDLGPVMSKIQSATNIDMKSTKVRVLMSLTIFVLVFGGSMFILDNYYNHVSDPPAQDVDVVEPDPGAMGKMVELRTGGYLDLTEDFLTGDLRALPLYDPELKLKMSLADRNQKDYSKIVWIVQTDSYNNANTKNPFYQKVTKVSASGADIYSVTWDNLEIGGFTVIASCYMEDGTCDVYRGNGIYYGKYTTAFEWTYDYTRFKLQFSMSSDDVRSCLNIDPRSRLDLQSRSSMLDFITDNQVISDLQSSLKTLYLDNYGYTDIGYTGFVLSFVQTCFPTVYDSFNYRVTDYWAYPMETLLWGCGDDEDKAILFSAIMKVAGKEIGLIVLPETTVAAVQLDLSGYEGEMATVRGLYRSYVVADTDSDLALGEIRPYYVISSDGRTIYYNGEIIHGRYGLIAMSS